MKTNLTGSRFLFSLIFIVLSMVFSGCLTNEPPIDPCEGIICGKNEVIDENSPKCCRCDDDWTQNSDGACCIGSAGSFKSTNRAVITDNLIEGNDNNIFLSVIDSVNITADPDNSQQFFINNFKDVIFEEVQPFTLRAEIRDNQGDLNTFEILNDGGNEYQTSYLKDDENGVLVDHRLTYTFGELETRDPVTKEITLTYQVEDFNFGTEQIESVYSNTAILTPQ